MKVQRRTANGIYLAYSITQEEADNLHGSVRKARVTNLHHERLEEIAGIRAYHVSNTHLINAKDRHGLVVHTLILDDPTYDAPIRDGATCILGERKGQDITVSIGDMPIHNPSHARDVAIRYLSEYRGP